jgi:soluble lytic murein transglycosylase
MRKRLFILLALLAVMSCIAVGGWYYWVHRFDDEIIAAAQKYRVDPALVKAIVYEESFFRSKAHSSQNAVGLMQITPVVAQEWMEATRSRSLADAVASVTGKRPKSEPEFKEALSDPVVSLHVGCWYLQSLLNRYHDEPDPIAVALAAYNAGPSNVERWASNADRSNMSRQEFIERIQFPVTRDYVQKIIERYNYYKRDQDIKQ